MRIRPLIPLKVTLGYLVVMALQVGCGTSRSAPTSSPTTTTDSTVPRLEFLRFTQGGAACASDCTTVHGVEAPTTLALEDASGRLTLTLQREEFQRVEQFARDPEFARIVADARAGTDCSLGFDVALSMAYKWEGQPVEEVPHIDDCGVTEGYVTRDLYQHLMRMKERYLACPPWEEPAGFQLAVDPLPERALCWFCYGKCKGEAP